MSSNHLISLEHFIIFYTILSHVPKDRKRIIPSLVLQYEIKINLLEQWGDQDRDMGLFPLTNLHSCMDNRDSVEI
jgi:hypothetical protein